jgi:hypothetical protein
MENHAFFSVDLRMGLSLSGALTLCTASITTLRGFIPTLALMWRHYSCKTPHFAVTSASTYLWSAMLSCFQHPHSRALHIHCGKFYAYYIEIYFIKIKSPKSSLITTALNMWKSTLIK